VLATEVVVRARTTLLILAALAATIAGCAAVTANAQRERGIDFSRYHTYAWGAVDALPESDARLATPDARDRLEGAVERALTAKGFEAAASPARADLLFHYHASINERLDVRRSDRALGYAEPNGGLKVTTFQAGTIVIDAVDARTNRVVWRGWAQRNLEGVLDHPARLAAMIDEAVAGMMARFPGAR
jgi:hypothetical protein